MIFEIIIAITILITTLIVLTCATIWAVRDIISLIKEK